MQAKNIGGFRLNVEAVGIDEALDKANRLVELLKEANSLKDELASFEIDIKFVNACEKQEDSGSLILQELEK